jgi:hypothetical protein
MNHTMTYINVLCVALTAYVAGISEHPLPKIVNMFAMFFNLAVIAWRFFG